MIVTYPNDGHDMVVVRDVIVVKCLVARSFSSYFSSYSLRTKGLGHRN